jgi:hypothetical protein
MSPLLISVALNEKLLEAKLIKKSFAVLRNYEVLGKCNPILKLGLLTSRHQENAKKVEFQFHLLATK